MSQHGPWPRINWGLVKSGLKVIIQDTWSQGLFSVCARDAENAGGSFLCQALEPQGLLCLEDPPLPLPNQGSPLEKPQRVEQMEDWVAHMFLDQCPGGYPFASLNDHTVHISIIHLGILSAIR